MGVFKKFSTIVLMLVLSIVSSVSQPPGKNWKLKWSDDFNGSIIDTTRWKVDHGRIRKGDANKTIYVKENVSVSNGLLKLKVDNKGSNTDTIKYTGGLLSSTGDFYRNNYGYYEARIRYNFTGPGFWGNFWMNTTEGSICEFDIAEVISNEPARMTMHYHFRDSANAHKQANSRNSCDWKQFHVYGIEWLEGQPLRFYIDGVKVFEPPQSMDYPADKKMNIILRMGAFNSEGWGGLPDSTSVYPGYAEYDWIKVWEKKGSSIRDLKINSKSKSKIKNKSKTS